MILLLGDAKALVAEMSHFTELADDLTFRKETVACAKSFLNQEKGKLQNAYEAHAIDGLEFARRHSALMDQLIVCLSVLWNKRNQGETYGAGGFLAVVATGGYGRRELAPFSDIDLLFLIRSDISPMLEDNVNFLLYVLWDLHLDVGHATRTLEECMTMAENDVVIATSLIDRRFLHGNIDLFNCLNSAIISRYAKHSSQNFVIEKISECEKRYNQQKNIYYHLEPDIKNGRGGLRDLQTILWIAKYSKGITAFEDLVQMGIFTENESKLFITLYERLWDIRILIHYCNNRKSDLLLFGIQIQVADFLGYKQRGMQKPVDRFMKHYFLCIGQVNDLMQTFYTAIEPEYRDSIPRLLSFFSVSGPSHSYAQINQHGHDDLWIKKTETGLQVESPDILDNPINIFKLIKISIEQKIFLHPHLIRQIRRKLCRIDEHARRNPEIGKIFYKLITDKLRSFQFLRLASQMGVLGRFIPEFYRIQGMIQPGIYHSYTVDEHSLLALRILQDMEAEQLDNQDDYTDKIFKEIENTNVLYFALFLHDFGKGSGDNHSIVGEKIAYDICTRLNIDPFEMEDIAWLIKHHLLMSDFSQKRDISDLKTIRNFSGIVQNSERLRLLYILTICDLRAVGDYVWNKWKSQLLWKLYSETNLFLSGEHEYAKAKQKKIYNAQEKLRQHLLDWSEEKFSRYVLRFFPSYWFTLDSAMHIVHARQLDVSDFKGIHLSIDQDSDVLVTRVNCYSPDYKDIFMNITGVLVSYGANILDARIFKTKDNVAISSFGIHDIQGQPLSQSRIDKIKQKLRDVLERQDGNAETDSLVDRYLRAVYTKCDKETDFQPRIIFDNTASDLFTVVEINGRDKVGLLYDLAKSLRKLGVNVFSAIIATYGNNIVDVFYVRNSFGMKIVQDSKKRQITEELMCGLSNQNNS
jgi:[protein-PII] uridylyltransferase